MARKLMKLLHTLGAVGLTGALVVHLMLLAQLPKLGTLAEQAVIRDAIAGIARFLLLPSLTAVLACGLLAIAFHAPFRDMRWVWAKGALGLAVFEATLVSVEGPALRNAALTARALAGEIDAARLASALHDESGAVWLILGIAITNVILGVWRPALKRRAGAMAPAPD
jgi:hypothetical protein